MAKPASLPSWATDTNLSSGTESGSTVKLEPSSGVKAQGWVPGTGWVGRWANWWANLVYQWTQYLDNLPNESAFTSAAFVWTSTHIWNGAYTSVGPCLRDTSTAELRYTDAAGASSSRTRVVLIDPTAALSGSQVTIAGEDLSCVLSRYQSGSDVALARLVGAGSRVDAVYPLGAIVPSGATITRVRARVNPLGTSTAALHLWTSTPNFSGFGSGSETDLDTDVSISSPATLDSGTISHAVTKSTSSFAVVVSNNGATSSDALDILGLEITFSDPGPRNY